MRYLVFLFTLILLTLPFSSVSGEVDVERSVSYYVRGLEILEDWRTEEDLDMAISQFNRAVEINPIYTNAYIELAYCYLKKYEMDPLTDEYFDVISSYVYNIVSLGTEFDEDYSDAYNIMGNAFEVKGDFAGAERFYSFATEMDSALGYKNLGNLYYRQGRYSNAVDSYLGAIELNPYDLTLYCKIVSASDGLGRRIDGYDDYNEICDVVKSYAPDYEYYLETGQDPSEARSEPEGSNQEPLGVPGFGAVSVALASVLAYFVFKKKKL